MGTYRIGEPEAALLRFVDNEATGIVQAFQMAAESNDQTAADLEAGEDRLYADVFRQSAESWRRKAAQFGHLYETVPDLAEVLD